jgi:hypothetical protein
MRIVDVSDPRAPREVGFYTGLESVTDVAVIGNQAFLAAGGQGLRVLNVADLTRIRETDSLDTPGEARGVAVILPHVFVADHTRGLRVVDVTDPANIAEVGFYDAPSAVRGVTVSGEYAFLSDAERGIRVEDVSNPQRPREVGHFDEMGRAEDIAIQGQLAYVAEDAGLRILDISNPATPVQIGFSGNPRASGIAVAGSLAYLTVSDFGLRIFDISNPAEIRSVFPFAIPGQAQEVALNGNYAYVAAGSDGLHIVNVQDPFAPKTASVVSEFRDARAVALIGNFAFVADGENGIWTLDVTRPAAPEIISFEDTPGAAMDLVTAGPYLFVADGAGGVLVLYALNPWDPVPVGEFEPPGDSVGIAVRELPSEQDNPGQYILYVASGNRGLQVLAAQKRAKPEQTGLYETPGTLPPGQLRRAGPEKTAFTISTVFTDLLIIGLLGFLFWLGFFAQFVLPLRSLTERMLAFQRLLFYVFGLHGPAIRIENGRILARPGEERRRGEGVAILDTASAAMLRTRSAFSRPVGPGVVFTRQGESIHQEAVDLHVQIGPGLGPLGEEKPFEERKSLTRGRDESLKAFEERRRQEEAAYDQRQKRRLETSALTRDGVEVVPNVRARFKLRGVKGRGGTWFGYDPRSVQLAITRSGVSHTELRDVPWNEVPGYLAVDVWREYLSKFTLNELFDPATADSKGIPRPRRAGEAEHEWRDRGETGFEIITRIVKARLTRPEVIALNPVGEPTGADEPSREFQLLTDMGIEMLGVSIGLLRFPPAVESQLVQQWVSTWLQRAQLERNLVERKRSYAMHDGKETALFEYAQHAARLLAEGLVDQDGHPLPEARRLRPDLQDSLEMLMRGTQQLVIRDTQLHRMLGNEEKELADLIAWVRR